MVMHEGLLIILILIPIFVSTVYAVAKVLPENKKEKIGPFVLIITIIPLLYIFAITPFGIALTILYFLSFNIFIFLIPIFISVLIGNAIIIIPIAVFRYRDKKSSLST